MDFAYRVGDEFIYKHDINTTFVVTKCTRDGLWLNRKGTAHITNRHTDTPIWSHRIANGIRTSDNDWRYRHALPENVQLPNGV